MHDIDRSFSFSLTEGSQFSVETTLPNYFAQNLNAKNMHRDLSELCL